MSNRRTAKGRTIVVLDELRLWQEAMDEALVEVCASTIHVSTGLQVDREKLGRMLKELMDEARGLPIPR